MDIANLNRRAARVSTIFNVLANVVVVIGAIGFLVTLIGAFSSDQVGTGLAVALGVVIYTILVWAGIQLSSLVAGYIYTRTSDSTQTQQ